MSAMMLPFTRRLARMQTANVFLRNARMQSTGSYQPPTPQGPQGNPHGDFYKTFGRPIIKNLLVAVLTYQVLYFSWMKLESFEVKQEKESQTMALEGELRGLTQGKGTAT